eukprot:CAMPEP_0174588896 /NCGR_PEP_ID=MMETSP0929-20130131/34803_1 /TAXON_ID=548131 ORGANISM="Ostreococcus mediterraneus, Strain clade-D-RCC2572" /NCGR_SAMPLE_ID=MMETSP0929 /ASSEMBLY_ACC=CAM_ASM_000573 /LENGTH=80 /DNA_ID=CAMNT_0015771025 /DNA_START=957 /DNA_END=1199 /DNA_ORIENTATION=+
MAMKVLSEFDKSVCKSLSASKVRSNMKGQLHTYRFCGNVWTFIVENATVSVAVMNGAPKEIKAKLLKVVACDGKLSDNAN